MSCKINYHAVCNLYEVEATEDCNQYSHYKCCTGILSGYFLDMLSVIHNSNT